MSQMIFVNLPVADLARSQAFYEAIGATNNPRFSNESSAMMSFAAMAEAEPALTPA